MARNSSLLGKFITIPNKTFLDCSIDSYCPRPILLQPWSHHNTAMLAALQDALDWQAPPLQTPPFTVGADRQAALANDALLSQHSYNLHALLTTQRFTPASMGSEFRSPAVLEPLVGAHELWPFVRALLQDGARVVMAKTNPDDLRIKENQKLLEYNNHSNSPESELLIKTTLQEDLDRGYALIISAETIQHLPKAMVCPLSMVVSSTINADGTRSTKNRLTHDQSYHFHKEYLSLNQLTDKEAYPQLIYGGTIERIIYSIISMRTHFPSHRILAFKTDFSKAYRRIHYHGESAVLGITASNDKAYIPLRLTFGGCACPHIWCSVSELIADLANDLIHNTAWNLESGPRAPPELMEHMWFPPNTDPTPFAPALPTLILPAPRPEGVIDVYIDDMIGLSVDLWDNTYRSCEAALLAIEAIGRRMSDAEQVIRDPLLNIKKLQGEGAPSETKIILGWKFCLRSLTMSLPTDKYLAYKQDLQQVMQTKKCTNKELEQLIGRLSFTAQAIPIARNFLGRLRAKHRPTAPAHVPISLTGAIEQRLLGFWSQLLEKVHLGVNLNLRTLRKPTNILVSDACPEGIGGFSITTGRAWRYYIPNPNVHHINTVEFLAAVVGILIELRHGDIPQYGNVLALTDNSSCAAWLHKSNFDELYSPFQAEIACKLATECINHDVALNPQHVPGKHNVVADALSRRWDTSDFAFPHLMFDHFPTQTPENLQIYQIPDDVASWICSTLALAPPLPPDKQKLLQPAENEHGVDGLLSYPPLVSLATHSSTDSHTYSASSYAEHSFSLSASDHIANHLTDDFNFPAHVQQKFWGAVSGKPLATWQRNFGTTTGQAPFTNMTVPTSSTTE